MQVISTNPPYGGSIPVPNGGVIPLETVTLQVGTDVSYDNVNHQLILATAGLYVVTWQLFDNPDAIPLVNNVVFLEDVTGNVYGKSGASINTRSDAIGHTIVQANGRLVLQLVNRTGANMNIVSAVSLDGVSYFSGALDAYRLA